MKLTIGLSKNKDLLIIGGKDDNDKNIYVFTEHFITTNIIDIFELNTIEEINQDIELEKLLIDHDIIGIEVKEKLQQLVSMIFWLLKQLGVKSDLF